MASSSQRPLDDPAAQAALLLIRLGLAVLAIGVPLSAVVSRRAVFTLLPVGAGLLLLAATLLPRPPARRRLADAVFSVAGLALFGYFVWTAVSLIWTPFPVEAAERCAKEAGTVLLVVLAAAFLPERTRTSNIYLFPLGLAAAALATGGAALLGPQALGAFQDADSTLERAVISLVVLVWPALGALALRERWASAGWLVVGVTLAAMAAWTSVALAALATGALAFALATVGPGRSGRLFGFIAACVILLAPGLPLVLVPLADALAARYGGLLPDLAGIAQSLHVWSDVVLGAPLRQVTGHGFDMATRAVAMGFLSPDTPRSLAFAIWYELGLVGALAMAVVAAGALGAAGRTSPTLAPFLLAEIVAGLTIALWGLDTTQLWWITTLGVGALAFANVIYGQYRTDRPAARFVAGAREGRKEPVL